MTRCLIYLERAPAISWLGEAALALRTLMLKGNGCRVVSSSSVRRNLFWGCEPEDGEGETNAVRVPEAKLAVAYARLNRA